MSIQRTLIVCMFVALAVCACAGASRAQEAAPAADKASLSSEPQWLWGEVMQVNAQTRTMQVKYLDYDTDIEKELVLTVDEKTKYENAKNLEEIKPQDTVSVDYITDAGGTNLALAVSLEKLEDLDEPMDDGPAPVLERVGSAPAAEAPAVKEEPAAQQQAAPVSQPDAPAAAPAETKQ